MTLPFRSPKTPDTTPQSQEAEQALLGAVLFDNEIFHKICGTVAAKHFYNPVHIRVFDVMAKLIGAGGLADAIVLKNYFSQDETLIDIGGVEYLALLSSSAPPAGTAKDYAALIKTLATRRELLRFAGALSEEANDPASERTPAQMIEGAESRLYRLAEDGVHQRGFVSMAESVTKTVEIAAAFARDGRLSGLSTGFKELDEMLGGLHKSDLIILAGRPSMGKTALATNIAHHIASHFQEAKQDDGTAQVIAGGRVGYFSLEMSDEQLCARLLAERARVPANLMWRGNIQPSQFEKIRDHADALSQIPFHIDDTGALSIGAMTARARRLKRSSGLDLIVVDYLQLMTGGGQMRRGTSRVEEVTAITQGLKAMAKELDVPVLALAQLSRAVEQRDDKRPQLSDLRESGSIEQDADVVIFAFRQDYYTARQKPDVNDAAYGDWLELMDAQKGKAELIISKQRHGPIGTLPLGFEPSFTRFHDLEETQDEHA